MELDLKMLTQKLLGAQATPPADLPVVSDYVMCHIYEPLRRGDRVPFTTLDFGAFDEDDLHALRAYMECYESQTCRLVYLSKIFCELPPCATSARSFC